MIRRSKIMIASTIYFTAGTIIAILLNPDYNIYEQFLSALGGTRVGWLFNSGVVFLGVASVIFFSQRSDDLMHNIVYLLGLISGILLIGIGVFVSGGPFSKLHDLLAITFFLMLVFLPLMIFYVLRTSSYRKLLLLFAVLTSILAAVGLFMPGVNQYVFQKLIVLSYIIFLDIVAIHNLDK